MTDLKQEENGDVRRFALYENDRFAGEIIYSLDGDILTIEHTEVQEGFEGKGLGKKLVEATVDYAGRQHLKIKAHCTYAQKVLKRMEGTEDILI